MEILEARKHLEGYMKSSENLLAQCRKQEILEFNECYVGLQYLYSLIHRLKVYVIDKKYSKEELSLLQRTYIQTHYQDQIVEVIFNEVYYSENKVLQVYEEQKQEAIKNYSELKEPVLKIQNEIKMLHQDQLFNLSTLNIRDEYKILSSFEQIDLTQSLVFNQAMINLKENNDTKLDSYIAIQSQILSLKVNLLDIVILQYWILQTQERKKNDDNREEQIITKYKDVNYLIMINQNHQRIGLSREQVQLFIQLLHYEEFEQFINQHVNQLNYLQKVQIQEPFDTLTSKGHYYQFRDCKFRIVEKFNDELNKILYSIQILGIQNQYHSVIDTQNIKELIFRLEGLHQLNISKLVSDPQLFHDCFITKVHHKINAASDPESVSAKLKMGSILLSDRFFYSHAALYLGCDLVFHYVDEMEMFKDQNREVVQGHFFKPDRFETFMNNTRNMIELQFSFLLLDRSELMDKALIKCKEQIQFDLTKNNCEHLAFEVVTNFKYSSQLNGNYIKSVGANVAKYFGLFGSGSRCNSK